MYLDGKEGKSGSYTGQIFGGGFDKCGLGRFSAPFLVIWTLDSFFFFSSPLFSLVFFFFFGPRGWGIFEFLENMQQLPIEL